MTILITGATGLVGSKITALCHERGWNVRYLTTSKDKIKADPSYQGFYWDPSEGKIDPSCLDGVDGIINLAGANIAQRWTDENREKILKSRTDSLRTLYSLLEEKGVRNIQGMVSASAVGIYPSSLTAYHTEDATQTDDSFLGEVTEAWEAAADRFNDFPLNVAKIRIGLVLAAEGGVLPKLAQPVKWYAGAALGSGEQWQSWIHLEDLAEMFLFVLTQQLSGTYNGVAPNPVTQQKLTREVAAVLGKPLFLPNIPRSFLYLMLGKMAYIALASHRVSSQKIQGEGFEFRYSIICPALQDLLGNSPGNKVEAKETLHSSR